MNLYEILYKNQKASHFKESDEMAFFLANKGLLSGYEGEGLEKLSLGNNPFDIVRANIVIRALLNKKTIERLYKEKVKPAKKEALDSSLSIDEYMAMGLAELPFLTFKGQKIYVPVFPSSINLIYGGRFEKLLVSPYKNLMEKYEPLLIDPFDYYGDALFDSYFTKLVAIKRSGNCLAAYDFDADSLYIINEQGRLDARFALFDKYLTNPTKTHMVKRLTALANAYFMGSRQDVINVLLSSGFLSERLASKIGSIEEKEHGEVLENKRPEDL
jgi:hypothetical protein